MSSSVSEVSSASASTAVGAKVLKAAVESEAQTSAKLIESAAESAPSPQRSPEQTGQRLNVKA